MDHALVTLSKILKPGSSRFQSFRRPQQQLQPWLVPSRLASPSYPCPSSQPGEWVNQMMANIENGTEIVISGHVKIRLVKSKNYTWLSSVSKGPISLIITQPFLHVKTKQNQRVNTVDQNPQLSTFCATLKWNFWTWYPNQEIINSWSASIMFVFQIILLSSLII